MQKQGITALLPVIMATCVLLIGGCDKQEKRPDQPVSASSPSPHMGEESYDCSFLEDSNPLKQSWCEAKTLFQQKHGLQTSSDEFRQYLNGYRHGINEARQAKTSRVSRSGGSQHESLEDNGYRDGYEKVVTTLGLIAFDSQDNSMPSEYRERWHEAADACRLAGLGGENNPFLKGRFIDGYMAGGRIALTVQTSMESFFNGDTPEGKQPAIIPPEGDMADTQRAFYLGFDEGYKAMIASIRESINQVMEQMQAPDNMQLPDGMIPPPAG